MAGEPTRMMLLPRYSSLVGATMFYTAPIAVRRFYRANFSIWRGAGNGVSALTVTPQVSEDMRSWIVAISSPATWTIAADTEDYKELDVNCEWLRLAITPSGTDPCVPIWIHADFLRRES